MNRLPFPNRNSDSGVLYIVFKRFHLIFPVAHLDFQVEARFLHFLSYLAYASRIASRIAYHHCIISFDPCTWLIVPLLLVCIVWVEPGDEFANEEPVEFAYEDSVNSDNFAGKMIIPSKVNSTGSSLVNSSPGSTQTRQASKRNTINHVQSSNNMMQRWYAMRDATRDAYARFDKGCMNVASTWESKCATGKMR